MSRENKFRVYDKETEQYLPISKGVSDGVIGITTNGQRILYLEDGEINIGYTKTYIIEQSTGLKDMNGKEIYKGDIVKFDCGDQTPAEVVYQDGSYFLKALDDGTLFYDPDANKPCPLGWLETYGLEVIGNVHENPELIGDEAK